MTSLNLALSGTSFSSTFLNLQRVVIIKFTLHRGDLLLARDGGRRRWWCLSRGPGRRFCRRLSAEIPAAPTFALGQALTEDDGSYGDLVGDPDLGLRFSCALAGLRLRRQRNSFGGRELVYRGQQVVLWPERVKRTL